MKKVFEVTGRPNAEEIIKYTEMENIFFRFQNPCYAIEGEYTQSWGMIYSTAEEAIENCEDDGLTEDEAVLSGKSCMPTFHEIIHWGSQFNDDDVLLIFKGYDTYETGHDGEYVADYDETVAVWSVKDVFDFYNNNMCDENGKFDYYEWKEEQESNLVVA